MWIAGNGCWNEMKKRCMFKFILYFKYLVCTAKYDYSSALSFIYGWLWRGVRHAPQNVEVPNFIRGSKSGCVSTRACQLSATLECDENLKPRGEAQSSRHRYHEVVCNEIYISSTVFVRSRSASVNTVINVKSFLYTHGLVFFFMWKFIHHWARGEVRAQETRGRGVRLVKIWSFVDADTRSHHEGGARLC